MAFYDRLSGLNGLPADWDYARDWRDYGSTTFDDPRLRWCFHVRDKIACLNGDVASWRPGPPSGLLHEAGVTRQQFAAMSTARAYFYWSAGARVVGWSSTLPEHRALFGFKRLDMWRALGAEINRALAGPGQAPALERLAEKYQALTYGRRAGGRGGVDFELWLALRIVEELATIHRRAVTDKSADELDSPHGDRLFWRFVTSSADATRDGERADPDRIVESQREPGRYSATDVGNTTHRRVDAPETFRAWIAVADRLAARIKARASE